MGAHLPGGLAPPPISSAPRLPPLPSGIGPGTGLTEAGVVRLIYALAGDEGRSCIAIAERLNALGVPPAYTRDGKQVLRGKRKQATSGIWRSGRIRSLLVSTTYRGLHRYGKRFRQPRPIIERPVPAIVDEALWERAQQTLRRNFMFGQRNPRRNYLLRGLMKCAHCGLTYIGTAYPTRKGSQRTYYVCNGKHQGRAIFGNKAMVCRSKAITGEIEDVVWRDVEGFLRNPGPVLKELAEKVATAGRGFGLFRRGRIDDETLERQLDEIERERTDLKKEIGRLEANSKQRARYRSPAQDRQRLAAGA